ncbi:MAG: hypothetical protein DRJ05_03110 [Bacteroidetes bacterium]|nr:MAG: hypothetical protein DRJ05_03110 [Bacteroidota bacterium]
MKSFILFFFSILFLNFGFAQDYYPLIEEDKTWYVVETGFPDFVQSSIYKCEGDTIINNETYKVLFFSGDDDPQYWIKYGYIKEDENHKVYFSNYYPNDSSYFEPALLYDFDAAINDSMTITSIMTFGGAFEIDIIITNIDSVVVDGNYRKRTWFECGYDNSYWIEGIGSNNGLLQVGFYCTIACPACDLQCVKKDDITIYPDSYTGSCFIVGIYENTQDKTWFNIFPNPATNNFQVEPISHIQSQLFFELYNSMGKLEIREDLDITFPTQILTGDLENGIYFYLISNKNGAVQKGKIVIR